MPPPPPPLSALPPRTHARRFVAGSYMPLRIQKAMQQHDKLIQGRRCHRRAEALRDLQNIFPIQSPPRTLPSQHVIFYILLTFLLASPVTARVALCMEPRLQLEFVLKAGWFPVSLGLYQDRKASTSNRSKDAARARRSRSFVCDLQIFLTGHAGEMSVRASATK